MLKYIFAFLMFLHGLVHIIGFAKAYGFSNLKQISKTVSELEGTFWFIAALLFVGATSLLLAKYYNWTYLAFAAVVISQILIIGVWKDAKYGTIVNIIILVAAIASYATHHFEMKYKADVNKHISNTYFSPNDTLKEVDINLLPLPIQKYIRYSGAINKPKVKDMRIVFDGEMREKGKDFFKFTSVQYNFFEDPTRLFFMKATMYGAPVPGYHCYQNENATMQIKLLGLFNVANVKGTEMNKAETVTLFNDMCLMAPASLIDKRIEWTAIDSLSTKATFTNGVNKITAILYFNEQEQLINFISDDRYAITDMKRYRFSTPVKEYEITNGINILKYGETIWHYPDGEFVYGKFTLKSIEYNVTAYKQ